MRGSPHSHGLFWINGAPEYKEGDRISEQNVTQFIDNFITCERTKDPAFVEKFNYQLHKHSSTCYKKCKYGKICRFGFPKPPLPDTRILVPLPKLYPKKDRQRASELYKKIQETLTKRGRNPTDELTFSEFLVLLNVDENTYITGT